MHHSNKMSFALFSVILIVLFLLIMLGSLAIGSVPLRMADVLHALAGKLGLIKTEPLLMTIVWDLRFIRSLLAGLCGFALSSAGAILQGLFRNSLADPYALGISSGAALGAVIAIGLGISSRFIAYSSLQLFAFLGAIVAATVTYIIGHFAGKKSSTTALLLAGAAVGAFLAAIVSFVMTIRQKDLQITFFWLLGGFNGKNWTDIIAIIPFILIAFFIGIKLIKPLDILGSGEESAHSLGVNIGTLRFWAMLSASLGTASAVAVSGIIGFIGLLGPHIARIIVGPSHKRLIVAAGLMGGILLLASDALARTILSPLELPVGVITALFGAPIFIWILATRGHAGKV